MSLKQKREAVLEKLYDELLEDDLDDFIARTYSGDGTGDKRRQDPTVQLIVALENANSSDKEIDLKGDVLAFDNANKEIDRDAETKRELARILITAGVTIVTNVAWGMIFVHELKATRQFEIDGTETSAAGRWLKTSFPKVKMF